MLGVISKWDILTHPATTVRCFGWRVFLRALTAGSNQTFLSILTQEGSFRAPNAKLSDVVERCVRLEQIAKGIYQSLAERFNTQGPIQEFFGTLARQEAEHIELLEMCRVAAMRYGWDGSGLAPLRGGLPLVEHQMREAEAKLRAVRTLTDGLWLTIEIESSEINQLFQAIVAATDSEFVRKFKRFRSSVRAHLSYIQGIIITLEPSLSPACERMLARCTVQSSQGTGSLF
jgi:rubrerythrin